MSIKEMVYDIRKKYIKTGNDSKMEKRNRTDQRHA